jgi:hypothetical protein
LKQDDIPEMVEASPQTRSKIMTDIWEYYLRVTTKPDPDQRTDSGKQETEDSLALAQRPG